MEKNVNNAMSHDLKTKVGDILVFTQREGKTIVCRMPDCDHEQHHNPKPFMPISRAKNNRANKLQKSQSYFNMALSDVLYALDIESIDVSNYTGKIGDTITIQANNDFRVKEVLIQIYTPDKSLVEKGNATLSADELHWVYAATTENNNLGENKVIIQVSDTFGGLTGNQQN